MPDFRNPAAFFLLFLVPALFIVRALGLFTRIAFPATLSDWGGKTFEWKGRLRSAASFISRIFIIAAFVLTVAALADPVVYHQERVYTSRGADILFVVDTSPSMAVKDIANMTRLEQLGARYARCLWIPAAYRSVLSRWRRKLRSSCLRRPIEQSFFLALTLL